jgi:hypothetical protein
MRSAAYLICTALVGIPVIIGWTNLLLSPLGVSLPSVPIFELFYRFGSLVPPMLLHLVPQIALYVLSFLMLFLFLRRMWLSVAKKQGTPASFAGFQKGLAYIGVFSFLLGIAALALSMALKVGSGVPGALLMIPAMLCIPWAFFITELLSFRRRAEENAA